MLYMVYCNVTILFAHSAVSAGGNCFDVKPIIPWFCCIDHGVFRSNDYMLFCICIVQNSEQLQFVNTPYLDPVPVRLFVTLIVICFQKQQLQTLPIHPL